MKWLNFIPFTAWMLFFLPLLMLAEYFSVKSGHDKMNQKTDEFMALLYITVGFILLVVGFLIS